MCITWSLYVHKMTAYRPKLNAELIEQITENKPKHIGLTAFFKYATRWWVRSMGLQTKKYVTIYITIKIIYKKV